MKTHSSQSGWTLVEVVILVMVIAIIAAVVAPPLQEIRRRCALRMVATRVGGMMVQSRAHAVFHRKATALVFDCQPNGRWRCTIAEDRDGDGVLRADIKSGIDKIIDEMIELRFGGASLGILDETRVPDPAGGGALGGDPDDPIRAGRGDIVTFTPRGTATPCSVYLTDNQNQMRVLRVLGMSGRVRSLEWREGWAKWRPTDV